MRSLLLVSAIVAVAGCAAATRGGAQEPGTQRPARPPSGDGIGNVDAGRAFAVQVCTPCHIVAPEQLSPRRFATGPDFPSVANAPGQTAMSLTVWLTATPHPSMPNLRLNEDEAKNVIAYILSLRKAR